MTIKLRRENGAFILLVDNCKVTVESLARVFDVLTYLKVYGK